MATVIDNTARLSAEYAVAASAAEFAYDLATSSIEILGTIEGDLVADVVGEVLSGTAITASEVFELLTGEGGSFSDLGKAIDRLTHDMARIIGAGPLMVMLTDVLGAHRSKPDNCHSPAARSRACWPT